MTGWVHWPDIIREVRTDVQAERQIRDLAASGLAGGVNCTRLDPGDNADRTGWMARWHIALHAGSEAERHAWVRSLCPPSIARRQEDAE